MNTGKDQHELYITYKYRNNHPIIKSNWSHLVSLLMFQFSIIILTQFENRRRLLLVFWKEANIFSTYISTIIYCDQSYFYIIE